MHLKNKNKKNASSAASTSPFLSPQHIFTILIFTLFLFFCLLAQVSQKSCIHITILITTACFYYPNLHTFLFLFFCLLAQVSQKSCVAALEEKHSRSVCLTTGRCCQVIHWNPRPFLAPSSPRCASAKAWPRLYQASKTT